MASTSPLIDAETLAHRLGRENLSILDASWYLPADQRDTRAEFLQAHIPGAVFFDIDANSDRTSPYPHMLASPEAFQAIARSLGVRADDDIVVYDSAGLFSAARVWWNFRVMGAERVFVLDGGLPAWRAGGHPVASGQEGIAPGDFVARFNAALVRSFEAVQDIVADRTATIVDARGAPRFRGEAAEPRPGVASGHIPGAANLPYSRLLNADGTLKAPAELEAAFVAAGVDPAAPIVTSCGSGVTASILALGLAALGHSDVPVYDGSWSEWGARKESAHLIAKGV